MLCVFRHRSYDSWLFTPVHPHPPFSLKHKLGDSSVCREAPFGVFLSPVRVVVWSRRFAGELLRSILLQRCVEEDGMSACLDNLTVLRSLMHTRCEAPLMAAQASAAPTCASGLPFVQWMRFMQPVRSRGLQCLPHAPAECSTHSPASSEIP